MCFYIKLNKNSKFGTRTVELVDDGSWTLLRGSTSGNKLIKYALNTGKNYYFLDKNGEIVSMDTNIGDFVSRGIVRFNELNTSQCA